MVKDYLLCYDIANEKRLYRTRKLSYPLSLGGQKSALHTPLSRSEAKKILTKLSKIIKKEEDKINIIEIDPEPLMLGRGLPLLFEDGAIII